MSFLDKDSFFYTAIKCGFPNASNIRRPESCHTSKPVFIADTRRRGSVICKFVDSRIAARDKQVSKKLTSMGFPLPKIDIHGYMAQWYEVYKYNPNRTFDQHIKDSMGEDKIFETYKQLLDFQAKLADCSLDDIYVVAGKYFSDVYKITAPSTRSRMLTAIYSTIIKIVSQYKNLHVMHCDLKPKNVICTPDGNLDQVIDVTGIALASEEFAMISLLESFPLPGKSEELMDYYDKITNRKLNRDFIRMGLKIVRQKQKVQSTLRDIKNSLTMGRTK